MSGSSSGWTLLYDGVFSDDGSGTLYLATNQGVRKTTDGGQSFSPAQPNGPVMRCLRVRAHALFGCRDINVEGNDFDVGKSTDDGVTWQPLLRYMQNIVGPVLCPAGSQVCVSCYPDWQRFAQQFGLSNVATPSCLGAGDAGSAGGSGGGAGGGGTGGIANTPVGNGGGKCGCLLPGRALDGGREMLTCLMIAAVAWRRRRGRREGARGREGAPPGKAQGEGAAL